MQKTDRIVYINPETNKLAFLTCANEMFNPKSGTRSLLRNKGIDFKSDDEVMQWIINKDVPQGVEYHIVPAENFPKDDINRNKWYYDPATNSVKDDQP